MRNDFFVMGQLEILRFVPQPLLKNIEFEALGIDDFLYYVALARQAQELEGNVQAAAISKAFSE